MRTAELVADATQREFVTMRLGPQMFGISVHTVQDVLRIVRVESVGDRKDVYK